VRPRQKHDLVLANDKAGFLFCTRKGKPVSPTNIIRRHLHKALKELKYVNPFPRTHKAGIHAFRRVRNTYLRNYTECPQRAYTSTRWVMRGRTRSKRTWRSAENGRKGAHSGWNCPQLYRMYRKLPKKPKQRKQRNQLREREKEWSGREDLNLRPLGLSSIGSLARSDQSSFLIDQLDCSIACVAIRGRDLLSSRSLPRRRADAARQK